MRALACDPCCPQVQEIQVNQRIELESAETDTFAKFEILSIDLLLIRMKLLIFEQLNAA